MSSNMYIEFIDPSIARFEVLSWSHGFAQQTSASRPNEVELAMHQNLVFTKYLDSNTNALMKACWSGKQFQSAILTAYRSGSDNKPVKYLTVTMKHVIVANVSLSGGPGDLPVENVALDYGIVTYEYTAQNSTTSVTHNLMDRSVT